MLTIATRVAKADTYRAIAEAHPEVWYTVGTHPHGAAEEPDVAAETIAGLAQASPRCVGISHNANSAQSTGTAISSFGENTVEVGRTGGMR